MTHTPGPWHRNIKPATKYNTVWSGRNTHVAYTAVQGLTPGEVEANISLIAAAPELLAALEACLPDLKHYVATHGPGPDRRLADALVAIAKAKGKTP